MKRFSVAFVFAAIVLAAGVGAFAQLPAGVTPNGVIGEVVAVDVAAKQVFVKTDGGAVVIVALADTTVYKRLPPGETTLAKAADIKLSDIGPGDRVFGRGKPSDDGKTVMARQVIVMTKSDISAKHEAERAEWRKRGVVGTVSALNVETKEITLQARGPAGPQPVVIPAGDSKVKFRRYAPDSVKFSDAKPSSFAELKVGDQLRALGQRSEDGKTFKPEEVVTGSFRTVMGTITAVDASKGEITLKPMQGAQPLTVVVKQDSMLRQVTPEVTAMIAQRLGGGGPGGPGGAPGAPGAQPAAGGQPQRVVVQSGGAPGAAPAGGAPAGERRMMMDPSEMLERLPPVTVAELKPGSTVAVSTTGDDPARVTAIQLVAGLDALMQMMQARPGGAGRGGNNLANFNLGFGIGSP